MVSFLLVNFVYGALPQNFNNNYTGKLGLKTDIVLSLKNTNGKLSGFYYYEKIGTEIKLEGEITNGVAIIYELDYQNIKRAKITGKFASSSFNGKWESFSSKKTFPVQLTLTNKQIPTLPHQLIGTYKVDEKYNCALSINIIKRKGEYHYQFKSVNRNLNGKVTFSRSLDEKLIYIDLHGIEWDEDSGDVTKDDGEESTASNELPTVVQGLLSDGEISIQNTGNAMNRYVKIGECDLKFIYLKRVK